MRLFRRELLRWAVRQHGGNVRAAERWLGFEKGYAGSLLTQFGLREELAAIRAAAALRVAT